ncbi:MAG: hypothetical protein ACTII7_11545 [Galactobacter sp.]
MITRLTSAVAVAVLAIAGLVACGPKPADGPAEGAAKSSQAPSGEAKGSDAPQETESPKTEAPSGGNKVDSITDLKNDGDYFVSDGGITYRFENGGVKIEGAPSVGETPGGVPGGSGDQPAPTTPAAGGGSGSGSGAGGLCDVFPDLSMASAKAFLPYVSVSSVEDIEEQLGYLDKVTNLDPSLEADMKAWKEYLNKAKELGGDTQKLYESKLVTPELRASADRLKNAYRDECR